MRSLLAAALLLALGLRLGQPSTAPDRVQTPGRIVTARGEFTDLSAALATAAAGETIDVYGGVYDGPVVIRQPVVLRGHDGAAIDGHNQGTVVKITAPDVTLRGFVVRNSGDSLDQENSGIAVEAPRALVLNNRLSGTLFGIYLREAPNSQIRGNEISSKGLPLARRGDPIRVWYSNDVLIEGNAVSRGRDVVLWYSERLTLRQNDVSAGRYGLHFMYCDDATIENNRLTDNSVGTFMMYSRRLRLQHNTIAFNRGPSGYGVGLKDMDDAVVTDNLFLDNRIGAFLDNSPREVDSLGLFENNLFAYNDSGITMLPSVRHNQFVANSFVENGEQVTIAGGGSGRQENSWSVDGVGNFWSDYAGYDADGDGFGDLPYEAERLFEYLLDREPALRLLRYSPIQQAVDLAAQAVPLVRPQPKLTDDAPLMAPTMPAALPQLSPPSRSALAIIALLLLAGAAFLLRLSFANSSQRAWQRVRWHEVPVTEAEGD